MTENNDIEKRTRIELLKEYKAKESGIWRIFGEDPNCDLGGPHHCPELDTVEGAYGDIVEYALKLPGFFIWGHGGRIGKLPKPKKINPKNKRR